MTDGTREHESSRPASVATEPRHDAHHCGPTPEVRMANDIAMQFGHQPRERAATEIAQHIQKFWDPRMRARLRQSAAVEPTALDPLALAAARRIDPQDR